MIGYAPFLGQVMIARPQAYRPPPYHPSPMQNKRIGQKGTIAAMGAVPLLAGTAVAGGVAWIGFTVGSKQRGILAVLGYTFGVLGALGALGGVAATAVWLLGVSLIPEPAALPKTAAPALPALPEAPRLPEMPRSSAEF